MKEKTTGFGDFLLCFAVSLVLKAWWLLVAIVLIVLRGILPMIPAFTVYIVLGVWVVFALFHALMVFWGNKSQDMVTPGCHTTSERLRAKEEAECAAAAQKESQE